MFNVYGKAYYQASIKSLQEKKFHKWCEMITDILITYKNVFG